MHLDLSTMFLQYLFSNIKKLIKAKDLWYNGPNGQKSCNSLRKAELALLAHLCIEARFTFIDYIYNLFNLLLGPAHLILNHFIPK